MRDPGLFISVHISFESSRHGEFLKKNGEDVICTLKTLIPLVYT